MLMTSALIGCVAPAESMVEPTSTQDDRAPLSVPLNPGSYLLTLRSSDGETTRLIAAEVTEGKPLIIEGERLAIERIDRIMAKRGLKMAAGREIHLGKGIYLVSFTSPFLCQSSRLDVVPTWQTDGEGETQVDNIVFSIHRNKLENTSEGECGSGVDVATVAIDLPRPARLAVSATHALAFGSIVRITKLMPVGGEIEEAPRPSDLDATLPLTSKE